MSASRRAFLGSSLRIIAGGMMSLALPGSLLRAASRGGTYLERAVYAMGTTVSVSAFGEGRAHLVEATSAAFAELYRLERLLSVFRPDSDIGRVNRYAGTGPVLVQRDTQDLLRKAKMFHEVSGGAFDVTVEPLMEQWGFRDDMPADRSDEREVIIGDDHLLILPDGSVLLDHPAVRIDTGGVAVGFAVDRMADVLRQHGIVRGLINHGGDIYAIGAPPDSDGWSVVIPHPVEPEEVFRTLSLKDQALSTSTNSRNTRHRSGGVIGHIFDPRTGKNPVACTSMTVMAQSSCEADALSTAAFVSGDPALVTERGCDYVVLRLGERTETSIR